MEEQQDNSLETMPLGPSNSSSESFRNTPESNTNNALASLDNKLGNLTDLLVRFFEQKDPGSPTTDSRENGRQIDDLESDEPLQGERPPGKKKLPKANDTRCQSKRPTGNKRKHNSDAELRNDRSTGSKVSKRQHNVDTQPLQGERPTGNEQTSDSDESENDSDCSSTSSKPARCNKSDDGLSIYAGDSADEETDLKVLADKCQTNKSDTSTLSVLDDLAKSLSEDETAGPNIEPKLAEITMKRWGKKLNPDKLKTIIGKYKPPANCTSMTTTGCKCNPEIWSQLSSTKKRTDLQLSNLQQVVLKAAVATLQTTNTLVNEKSDTDKSELLTQSIDTVALLAHAHTQVSQLRRDQIKPVLKQEYSTICSAEVQPDSNWLFGSDLAKTLKDAKEASHISSSFKHYSTKPYSNNKRVSRSNKNNSSYKQPQRNFLWRSQSKYQSKRKGNWNRGKTEDSK